VRPAAGRPNGAARREADHPRRAAQLRQGPAHGPARVAEQRPLRCPGRRGGRAVECGGLENRYPSFGGSRVQIPPPPLTAVGCRLSRSEQRRGETAAVTDRERVLLAELIEERDGLRDEPLSPLAVGGDDCLEQQVERSLEVVAPERVDDVRQLAGGVEIVDQALRGG